MICIGIMQTSCCNVSFFWIGCPRVLRSDHGTENCHLATAQITFRFYGTDALPANGSFRYGNLLQTQYLEQVFRITANVSV